jgi:hypothetical protein
MFRANAPLSLSGVIVTFWCYCHYLPWAYQAGGAAAPPPSLLGKQSQSGNIRFTVWQYKI